MKNFKFLSITFLFAGLMFFTSCGSDVDCDDPNTFNELTSLSEDFIDVTFAFTNDPTNEDACNALIDLINDLIDESENIRDCVPGADRAQFDADLEQLQDSRDLLTCG